MPHQVRQTVILGHGGKQGSSKTLLAGSSIDIATAAKVPGFISSVDSAAPVKAPPEPPVSKEINSAKANVAPAPAPEQPKSESAVVKPQDKGAAKKKVQKAGPQPLPATRNEVKAMNDADSRQLSRDLGIEFADDETTDVIQDRIVKELGLV